jgi:hypothetical protein
MASPFLSPREKAALLWAEHVTRNTARARDDVYEAVREHFAEAELVELTLMVGFFNMYNRFMDALQIPIEAGEEVNKIKRSVRLDPGTVKRYLADSVAAWPKDFPRPDAQTP